MAMDTLTKRSSKGASKGSGEYKDSEVVCRYCETKGRQASDCRKKQKDHDKGQPKGVKKEGDSKERGNKKELKGTCYKCGKAGHMPKDCRAEETKCIRSRRRRLGRDWVNRVASIDLNSMEIGAVQLPEEDRKIRTGIDSCAAVTAFPKTVADDHPMLQTSGKAKSYRYVNPREWRTRTEL